MSPERSRNIMDELRGIVGPRVSNSPAELCCYSCDASQVYGLPEYVVRPLTTEEVSRILSLAYKYEIPVTARGAGTGLAGGAVPLRGGMVLDMSGMNKILEIDVENLQVHVEPGVVVEHLNRALKPHGFFFPPNPGSSSVCTIGGLISNNGSGMRCVKYGTTKSYVLDLEVVLADGKVIRTGSRVLKSSAGYDLTRLMVGAEGTLGIITAARLRIVPIPRRRRLVMASFESSELAGMAVVKTFSAGIVPSACEIMDSTTVKVLRRCDPNIVLPDGDVILFEVDGTDLSTSEDARRISEACAGLAQSIRIASDEREMSEIWAARELVGAAISRLDPSKSRVYVGEDVGVPMKEIPNLMRKVQEISDSTGIPAMKYGHIGDGNLHVAWFIDVSSEDEWTRLRRAADMIHRAAIELGGTVSSEHGIGGSRAEYMEMQWGPALDIMRAIKRALDPKGILNPGKLGL